MAKTSRRRSLRRTARRVRRNPPTMTPAMRRKIGNRIRALHRAGKYRKSSRSSAPRRAVRRSAARSATRAVSVYRRSPARRSNGGGSRMLGMSSGALGIGAVLSKDNLLLAGGALGATFLCNYATTMIAPKLPGTLGTNPFVQAAMKIVIAGVTAKVAARYSRPLAQGILIGGALVVANDLIKRYMTPGSTGTGQYLGQYLGATPRPRSMVGAVSPTARTFAPGLSGIYGGGSAFRSDAWSR